MTTTSIQMGSPSEDFPSTSNYAPEGANLASTRVSGGSVSLNVGGDATVRGAASQLNTADMIGEGGGLVCRSVIGSPRNASSATADDLVTVGGQEMKLGQAERLGFVSRDANGRWVETGAAEAVGQEQPEAAPQDTGEALSDTKAEAALAGLSETVTQGTQLSVLHQIVSEGTTSATSVQRAASEAGVHPSQMADTINGVYAGFEKQAFSTVKSLGADDPQEFFNWAHEKRPAEMRKAMMTHATERSTSGYAAMYGAYVESIADSDPDAILGAQLGGGMTAALSNGVVVLNVPGHGQVSFKAAVKSGLVKVRGA